MLEALLSFVTSIFSADGVEYRMHSFPIHSFRMHSFFTPQVDLPETYQKSAHLRLVSREVNRSASRKTVFFYVGERLLWPTQLLIHFS